MVCSLRARNLRPRRRGRRLLLLAQRVEHAAALPERSSRRLLRRAAGVLHDGTLLALLAGEDREHQAGGEKSGGQNRSRAGQDIGRPPALQKSAGRADAEPASFRLLQQHDADHGGDHHQMNHDNDGLHAFTNCSHV